MRAAGKPWTERCGRIRFVLTPGRSAPIRSATAAEYDTKTSMTLAAQPKQKSERPKLDTLRILHVHSGNIYGGVEVGLGSNARLGPCRGIEPDFALCFDSRSAAELRASGRPVHILGPMRMRYPWQVMRGRRRLDAVIEATHYDAAIIHNMWGLANFARVIRAHGLPLLFHLHGTCEKDKMTLGDRVARRWRPDLVMCNSAFSASTLDGFFPGINRTVVCHPFQMRQTAPDARATERRQLGIPENEIVLIQASRLDEWKGHRLHLEALARIRTARPWRSLIAGGPQHPGEQKIFNGLIAYSHELGLSNRVTFLGQRQDVPELLAAADVLCQPNTGPEPFGLAFIEALSAGLPVVTSAMGGALEIIEPSCGFLLPPDADAVARALTTLIEGDALRMGMSEPAMRRAREICDPDRQTRLMHDAITSVLRPERSR